MRISGKLYQIFITISIIAFAGMFLFVDIKKISQEFPLFWSFIAEAAAGFLGISLGLLIDFYRESDQKKDLSDHVKKGLIEELQYNKQVMNSLRKGLLKNKFIQFQTTIWDMFKDKLWLSEFDVYIQLGQIYHLFIEFNNNINACGSVELAKDRMGGISEKIFYDAVEKIEEIIQLLEKQ